MNYKMIGPFFAAILAICAVFSFMKDTVRKGSDVEKKLDTRY